MQEMIRKYREHGCGCPPKQADHTPVGQVSRLSLSDDAEGGRKSMQDYAATTSERFRGAGRPRQQSEPYDLKRGVVLIFSYLCATFKV
jgi:hypothetical protein